MAILILSFSTLYIYIFFFLNKERNDAYSPIRQLQKTSALFLWDEKGDKIKKKNTNDKNYTKGELKMLDIQSFNNALKAKWVQRYLDPNNKGKWELLPQGHFSPVI